MRKKYAVILSICIFSILLALSICTDIRESKVDPYMATAREIYIIGEEF